MPQAWNNSYTVSTGWGYAWTGLNTLNQVCSPIPISVGGRVTQIGIYGRGGDSNTGATCSVRYGMWDTASGALLNYTSQDDAWSATYGWQYSSAPMNWAVSTGGEYQFGFWCYPSQNRLWATQNGYRYYYEGTFTSSPGPWAWASNYLGVSSVANMLIASVLVQEGFLSVNNNGTWSRGIAWVNNSGTWTQGKAVWVNNNGVWTQNK